MPEAMVQLVAAVIATAHVAALFVASRWWRPGRDAELRVRLRAPLLIDWVADRSPVVLLIYPLLVVVAPGLAYQGWLNWSSGIDVVLQAVGLAVWALGMAVGVWAARVIGRYMAVDGVAADHRLVVAGPYRYVRHPVYASIAAIAIGTTLVFRSYLLLVVTVASLASILWWAAAEERLLSSPEGLGDTYRTYASRTGRLLPRVRRVRR